MVYNRKLSVRFLDFQLGGSGLHSQRIIIGEVCDHLFDSMRAWRKEHEGKSLLQSNAIKSDAVKLGLFGMVLYV